MSKKIYYENDNFKLLHGDALLLLKKIEPNSIDMIFADPPYFLSSDGITCSGGKMVSVNKGEWDKKIGLKDMVVPSVEKVFSSLSNLNLTSKISMPKKG